MIKPRSGNCVTRKLEALTQNLVASQLVGSPVRQCGNDPNLSHPRPMLVEKEQVQSQSLDSLRTTNETGCQQNYLHLYTLTL